MIPPVIIGLTGSARAGKTTVAEHLRDKHGFHILSFADPLKAMVKKLDPIIGLETADFYGNELDPITFPIHLSDYLDDNGNFAEGLDEHWIKSEFPEYRRILQVLGTECIRGIDQNFWVGLLEDEIAGILLHDNSARIVIADIRFPNEAEVVEGWNAIAGLATVYRPGFQGNSHSSEAYAGGLGEETILINDSSIEVLRETVDGYVANLLESTGVDA